MRLFIVDHSLSGWVSNAVYTAVSRVRLMDQIVRVLPPGDVKGPLTPTALQATPSQALIEARLKRYVIEDRQKGRPKNTGTHHKLTVDYILDLVYIKQMASARCAVSTYSFKDTQSATGKPSALTGWTTAEAIIGGTSGSPVFHVIAGTSGATHWTSTRLSILVRHWQQLRTSEPVL